MQASKMDNIPDCFTKTFFGQEPQIEASIVRCFINNGYKTKLSLQVFDLSVDLQLLDIRLAQKSLVRKYISALQTAAPLRLKLKYN